MHGASPQSEQEPKRLANINAVVVAEASAKSLLLANLPLLKLLLMLLPLTQLLLHLAKEETSAPVRLVRQTEMAIATALLQAIATTTEVVTTTALLLETLIAIPTKTTEEDVIHTRGETLTHATTTTTLVTLIVIALLLAIPIVLVATTMTVTDGQMLVMTITERLNLVTLMPLATATVATALLPAIEIATTITIERLTCHQLPKESYLLEMNTTAVLALPLITLPLPHTETMLATA